MKKSTLILAIALLLIGIYQTMGRLDRDRLISKKTTERREQWRLNQPKSPLPFDVYIKEDVRFCSYEYDHTSELILFKNGHFIYQVLGEGGKPDIFSRKIEGNYSLVKGEIFFAANNLFYSGSLLMIDSNLNPKSVSFGRLLLNFNDCKNFVL